MQPNAMEINICRYMKKYRFVGFVVIKLLQSLKLIFKICNTIRPLFLYKT